MIAQDAIDLLTRITRNSDDERALLSSGLLFVIYLKTEFDVKSRTGNVVRKSMLRRAALVAAVESPDVSFGKFDICDERKFHLVFFL